MNQMLTDRFLSKFLIPGILTAVFLVSFWPAIQKLSIRWDSGDDSYCYLIVPLFLYLCWERRDKFDFSGFSYEWIGLFPVILSLGLILVGEVGSVETLGYIGLWGCVVGISISLYGTRMKELSFPLLILLFIVPLPPFVNRLLTFQMKMAASKLAVEMLRAVGTSVTQTGNIIDLGVQQLQVVDACSGLRYFMPLILMALLVGYFFSNGFRRRAVLLVLVVPLAILVNGFRIFGSGLLILNGHKELAEGFTHDFTGWLVFIIAGGSLLLVSYTMKFIGQNPRP